MNSFGVLILTAFIAILSSCNEVKKTGQNPSPMAEDIRPHERVDASNCAGVREQIESIFDRPAAIFIPADLTKTDTVDILIHFHGSAKVTEYAACRGERRLVVVTINLGSGSSKYEKPLREDRKFSILLSRVKNIMEQNGLVPDRTFISGFSAGYGAIRSILSNPTDVNEVAGVVLLDGLHTDYQPDGKTLFEGGQLNIKKLDPFLVFAELAVMGKKHFLFTHSSIFPGTYASTTECADYLIKELGLERTPTLRQGPLGMQLLGETKKEGLEILAFAGNTAPDHIDHLHGLYAFMDLVL